MWLINTKTLKLEYFIFPHVPRYAILSHTWGDDEVSFQQFKDLEKAKTKGGFAKIEKTCQLALKSTIEYAWVDTCCIDKSSSAELSESINSMYSWYQRARVCYAFLSDWRQKSEWVDLKSLTDGDWEIEGPTDNNQSLTNDPDVSRRDSTPSSSNGGSDTLVRPLRWFTRGWTLQELIAPTNLEFYDSTWNFRGSKSDLAIIENLSRITGVSRSVLKDDTEHSLRGTCFGQRMSWAAHRQTSRTEDIAYCLLGIFQVNMHLLYGEGDSAFLRLQKELIKSSTDLSIFAWSQHHQDNRLYRGILSCHPREFAGLGNCRLFSSQFSQVEEIAVTNKGLRMHTSLFYPYIDGVLCDDISFHHLYLGCVSSGHPHTISLCNLDDAVYVREEPKKVGKLARMRRDEARTIFIALNWDNYASTNRAVCLETGIRMHFVDAEPYYFGYIEAWPPGLYDRRNRTILTRDLSRFFGYVKVFVAGSPYGRNQLANFVIVYCGDTDSGVSVCLIEGDEADRLTTYTKSIWDMNPVEAEDALLQHFSNLLEKTRITLKSELTGVGLLLHISVTAEACRWPEIQQNSIQIHLEINRLVATR